MRGLPLCLLLLTCASGPRSGATNPLGGARQVIVVRTAGWNAVDGTLERYVRRGADDDWHRVGDRIPVVVGRNGMAWGRGLHPPQAGLQKKEGDGRAPAGVFRLSTIFGYEARSPDRFPFQLLTETTECVDDPNSKRYNVVVERKGLLNPDWKSAEKMRREDGLYALGVVVDHNAFPATPGGGSCIFLHIWSGPSQGTAGCTAMDAGAMGQVANWLNQLARPVLVQLPDSEYKRLHDDWHLP